MAAPVSGPTKTGEVASAAPVVLAGLNDSGEVTPFRTNSTGELVFSSVPDAGAAGGDLSGTYPDPQIAAGVIVNADVNAAAAIVASKLSVTVRVGAGVPAGAPTGTQLPLAYDTSLVTGGFYFWNGAAWVKVATIL